MSCKVKVSKNALDYFRRLARQSSNEIEAYLIGEIVSPKLVVIDKFCYTKEYSVQTPDCVQWYGEDLDSVRRIAERKGKRIVGAIHTHPNYEAIMSESDHVGQLQEGLRILGICSVIDNRTDVKFWLNESSLPCDIIYKEK